MLYDIPTEIIGLKAGIIGLGVSGTMIAEALQFMGAEVSYFSRTRKPEKEAAGFAYRPLKELLAESQVVLPV
ncbi:MAG: NAD(P)-dependent oxidoreductase [Clostridium sp.]